MTDGIQKAWALDIDWRLHDLQPSTPRGWQVNVHEIQGGQVYRDERVTVAAIPVLHGAWEAFAYRIETRDKTIVLSGDARPSPALATACQKCDVLIFEVYTMGSTEKVTQPWREHRRAYHTSTKELGGDRHRKPAGAAGSGPPRESGMRSGRHQLRSSGSEAEALAEMHQFYAGKVVEAHDLDVCLSRALGVLPSADSSLTEAHDVKRNLQALMKNVVILRRGTCVRSRGSRTGRRRLSRRLAN